MGANQTTLQEDRKPMLASKSAAGAARVLRALRKVWFNF